MMARRWAGWLVAVGCLAIAPAEGWSQAAAPAGEVLTNASVVQLVESKLARNLIIAKIRDSRTTFDVTAAGLVSLHERKVHREIIQAMLSAAEGTRSDEVLTNQSVFQMVEGKLPNDLIIAKIRRTRTAFDVSTDGLVSLQQRKVPRNVIEAMMQAGS